MCVVWATRVLPSQVPVVNPARVCSAYLDGMRTAVHPNCERRPILPGADGVGNHISLERVGFAPVLQTNRSLDQIKGGPPLALAFHHGDELRLE